MRYLGKVYRPPSEAYSLIVQVTYGCSHNGCAFCDMYDDKHFSMRPMDETREDFEMARRVYSRVERVFLADGDALMRKTSDLLEILGLIYGLFPECQRVTCYASPTSLQIKSEEDLRLRGPGDFFGRRQHGLPQLGIADLAADMRVLKEAQQAAQALLEADPGLSRREHAPLLGRVRSLFAQHGDMFN